MATTCSQVATLTTTEVLPTGSTFIDVTSVLTTLPGSTLTTSVATLSCTTFNESSTCFTTLVPTTTVIPGDETFTLVTITGIADNVFTTTRTLFGNVCTTIAGDPGTVSRPVSPKPGSDSSTRPVGSPSPRTTPSITTPTSSASTTADASVATSAAEKKSTSLGPIIGGAVGGIVVLAIVIWLGWKFFYKPMKATKAHNDFWDGKEEMAFAGAAGAAAGGAAAGGQAVSQNPFCGEPQHAPVNANTSNTNANPNNNGNGPENQQQQQQAQQQTDQNQWPDKPHRLPKKAEEMLQEKLDEWVHGAPAGAVVAAAAGSVAPGPYDPYHQQQQQNYANNNTIAQPPSPPRPTSTGSFTSQPSFGTAGVGAFNQQSQQQQQQWSQAQPVAQGVWNTPAPHPASQPQYNAPAGPTLLGQTVYPQQPFAPPTAQNYQGYAEPSR